MGKGAFKVAVDVVRTAMCGGGTSYDVYIPVRTKAYRPITGHIYATVICRDGREYYHLSDWLRDQAIDGLEPLTDERWNAFKRLERIARRLEVRLAKRAFPELAGLDKLPFLWAQWDKPSDTQRIRLTVSGRNYARLCA